MLFTSRNLLRRRPILLLLHTIYFPFDYKPFPYRVLDVHCIHTYMQKNTLVWSVCLCLFIQIQHNKKFYKLKNCSRKNLHIKWMKSLKMSTKFNKMSATYLFFLCVPFNFLHNVDVFVSHKCFRDVEWFERNLIFILYNFSVRII